MTREEVLRVLADNIRECVKEGWDGESAIAEALERLDRVEAERWVPRATAPAEQGDYLCLLRSGTQVVLSWDGIAWDHPWDHTSPVGWRVWNQEVAHWRPQETP